MHRIDPPATLLVLLSAPARTGIIAPHFGIGDSGHDGGTQNSLRVSILGHQSVHMIHENRPCSG
jgi:hypothetical protein